ncbi:ectoine/hydroxyectoine ABC transporter,ATP-binding protein [Streptomyces davaonensis JCM 4913]|uniref:Ectoine/hydroxyectoine ABC transporter,ATP-binding protein n=1 Tax=Streptomyces davaonensis (strain DSM 101723 / JCM 4913 / KCC S-0913 / 768) TaxID=1214101 RepID=K4R348_STRDJ|nr:ectoine/hydroxyectoine ABC transporter,ATP-binding protein [Streptomyces davaonensis JCM 4913]
MGEPYPKVRAHDLTRTFGRGPGAVAALGPLELTTAPGEFVCVVGPSGCGKSTLLRIAAGLLRPSTGRLEIRTSSPRPAAMIFQDYGIYDWKSVRANVRFGLDIQGVPRREANALRRHAPTGGDRQGPGRGTGAPSDGRASPTALNGRGRCPQQPWTPNCA